MILNLKCETNCLPKIILNSSIAESCELPGGEGSNINGGRSWGHSKISRTLGLSVLINVSLNCVFFFIATAAQCSRDKGNQLYNK